MFKQLRIFTAVLVLSLHSSTQAAAPIVFDTASNQWQIDSTASFPSSELTFDIRRFATIPENSIGTAPRLNALTHAPGTEGLFVVDSGRRGLASSPGKIYHVSPDGQTVNEVLDVADAYVLPRREGTSYASQGGVRGVAFHPQFNLPGTPGYGRLYTTQIVNRPADPSSHRYLGSSAPNNAGDGLVLEWSVTFDDGRFSGIDNQSSREIFRIAAPETGHPLKQLAFNPHAKTGDIDYGLLYISHGDGSSSTTEGTGQNESNALGKLIRINPLDPDGDGAASYSVPASNPYIDDEHVVDELYAIGLRNPHNFSFAQDNLGNDHLFIADIGHRNVEEINLLSITNRAIEGGNFGWGNREGTFVRDGADNILPLPEDDKSLGYTYPVAQYGRTTGAFAIAGGYAVQNGSELDGHYFFSDFSTDRPMFAVDLDDAFSARLNGDPNDLTTADIQTISLRFDQDNDPSTPSIAISSFLDILKLDDVSISRTDLRFGQGAQGEIYLTNKWNGTVYQIANSIPEPSGTCAIVVLTCWLIQLVSNRRGCRGHEQPIRPQSERSSRDNGRRGR